MRDPLRTAIAAALEAGTVLEKHRYRPLHIEEKGRRADLVTDADRASEAAIVARLLADFPSSAILGEEGGTRAGISDERWIVDPLDGTTNFAHGYPFFCISIAYERAGEVRCGVVYAPAMKEIFAAEAGSGARCNGEPIGVSDVDRLSDSMLVTGFKPYDYETNAPYFAHASHHAQAVRRDGSAALDLAYTAAGRFDAFWEFGLAPWDTAAGSLLVREGGGTLSAVDGTPFTLDGLSILASNGRVHNETVALFAPLLRG